jgi:Rrf2 family protein
MKFSTTTRYGLRAMVYIARKNKICSVKEISEAEEISPAYLEKIILKLSKAGLIEVKRGTSGGYFLARPAENITVEDVVKVLEKSTSLAPCVDPKYKCSRRRLCPTKNIWEKVYNDINLTLRNITLKDLIK